MKDKIASEILAELKDYRRHKKVVKAKNVIVKAKKVMVMYSGRNLSLQAIENIRRYQRQSNKNCVVHATVPAKIKQLLLKEADTQGLNMSAMINQALVMYLQDCGTKLEA